MPPSEWLSRAVPTRTGVCAAQEVPVKWMEEKQVVERNQLRVALHLNAAACALKLPAQREYPHLQTPKMHYDVQKDAIFHCERVLASDKHNVKVRAAEATQMALALTPTVAPDPAWPSVCVRACVRVCVCVLRRCFAARAYTC